MDQNDEDFSYGRVDRLELRSFSPSSPRVGDWIDLRVRALDRHGNRVRDYRATLDIEVEEYRNGSWKPAYSSDFSLDQHRISFSSSDRGEKTFSDLIKFKSSGEFRIRLVDRSHYALSTSRELRVYGTSEYVRNKGTLNFTSKELSKIRAVAEIWKEVMIALERDYPRLRRSTEWKRHSENFYDAMQKILKDDRYASYQDWNAFYRGFQDWFSLTIKTR